MGATFEDPDNGHTEEVSIHAPVMGATNQLETQGSLFVFLSTPP